MSEQKIAIIGAGLMGRLLAWRLLQQGRRVALFERTRFDSPRSAAHTAAAMISPMSEVVVSERSIYEAGMNSLAMWPIWMDELNFSAPEPVHYSANGSIVVAHPQDEAELHQFYQDLDFHLEKDNNAQWLNKTELAQKEPDLGMQFDQALFLPGEAYLDNRLLLQALLDEIKRLGGECFEEEAVELDPFPKSPKRNMDEYDIAIDCRGIGARSQNKKLRGVRGEVLWVETQEVILYHPVRLMHPRYKLYIVPKPGNRFIIGATEIESEDDSPVSVHSMLELCSALYTLNPAFAEARILELDANLRPSFMDNLPLIQEKTVETESGQRQHVVEVNGLYRHGYLLAPTLVNDLLNKISQIPNDQNQRQQSDHRISETAGTE